jgi:RimJ/RimL family protein N-acetyltransferase
MEIARVQDARVVMAVMKEAWEIVKDDSPVSFEDYNAPLDENNRWYASYEDDQLVALFYVHRLNLITWQLHIQFRPQYWGKDMSTAHSKALLDYIWKDTECKKLYAIVPAYADYVLKLAKRVGFKQEGRTKKSFQKNGVIHDQIHIGVYR